MDFGNSECSVRINSVSSNLYEEDLRVILGSRRAPQALHLPKVDSIDNIKAFVDAYKRTITARDSKVALIMFIESARALLDSQKICQAAFDSTADTNLTPEALVFGSDDYVSDIGATRTPDAFELIYARLGWRTSAKTAFLA